MTFVLHPRLEADTLPIGELGFSTVRLMDDARFPWLVLIPRRSDVVELFDLEAGELSQLTQEIAAVARVLSENTDATKINVGAIGNLVSQLHVHVIARRTDDAAWPGTVWGFGEPARYPPAEAAAFAAKLSAALGVR